jgi:hypothetical protein
MSETLRIMENEVQVVALSFMAVVYSLRLVWLFRFRSRKERSRPEGRPGAGIAYSLMNIALPWAMESTRKKPGFYVQFVVFHAGVAAAIGLTFIIPYAPGVLRHPPLAWLLRLVIGAAGAVGVLRFIRRLRDRAVRLISTADDFASLALMILFFAAGVLSVTNDPRASEAPLLAFFGLTALFLVYVPFSKIGHYLYYPFTHFFLGRSLGRRGVYPPGRRTGADTRPPASEGR